MSKTVELSWSYEPNNFLETSHKLEFSGIEIIFYDGQIHMVANENIFVQEPHFIADTEQVIKNFLNGVSIQSHSSFELSRKPTKFYNEDGTLDKVLVTGGSTSYVLVGGQVDFKVLDKHGNVKRDSKTERIEDKKSWGILISNIQNDNQKLVNSYLNAIEDKDNELVHLYEIRDFVTKKLGGAKKAMKVLSITKPNWNLFGEIANDRPIFEGRHRGKHIGQLRKATNEELNTARKIAKNLLRNYLEYCKSTN